MVAWPQDIVDTRRWMVGGRVAFPVQWAIVFNAQQNLRTIAVRRFGSSIWLRLAPLIAGGQIAAEKRASMAASCARVAPPVGSRVPSGMPFIMPSEVAQRIASTA